MHEWPVELALTLAFKAKSLGHLTPFLMIAEAVKKRVFTYGQSCCRFKRVKNGGKKKKKEAEAEPSNVIISSMLHQVYVT
jgi:hypothetical protein